MAMLQKKCVDYSSSIVKMLEVKRKIKRDSWQYILAN